MKLKIQTETLLYDEEFGLKRLKNFFKKDAGSAENLSDKIVQERQKYYQFMVDTNPMVYFNWGDHSEHYNEETEEEPLSPEYLAKLKEIEFPMCASEGLNSTLPYLDQVPKDLRGF